MKEKIEQGMEPLKKRIEKQGKEKGALMKRKDWFIKEINKLNMRIEKLRENIKFKDNIILEYQKKYQEIELKLKEQQKAYESVRSDKNTYSKNLVDNQDQISEVKKRLRIVTNQIGIIFF